MIGNYLGKLFPAQEDVILTTPFQGGNFRVFDPVAIPCLVEVAHVVGLQGEHRRLLHTFDEFGGVPRRYDSLCIRFGEARVNAAIRNRVLRNRAQRVLAGVRQQQPQRQVVGASL